MWTDDYADMRAYAIRNRVSIANIVRAAVREYINEEDKKRG